jgi:hypothetical protein
MNPYTRLVIGTSRTVGSAKKFVRITSGLADQPIRLLYSPQIKLFIIIINKSMKAIAYEILI